MKYDIEISLYVDFQSSFNQKSQDWSGTLTTLVKNKTNKKTKNKSFHALVSTFLKPSSFVIFAINVYQITKKHVISNMVDSSPLVAHEFGFAGTSFCSQQITECLSVRFFIFNTSFIKIRCVIKCCFSVMPFNTIITLLSQTLT